MSWAALALGLRLTGVVDRVEGDVAVVCWGPDQQADLPLAALPRAREGAGLVLRVRPAPRGALALNPRALAGRSGRLDLPVAARLEPGRTSRNHLRTHRVRPTPRPPAAPLPDRIDLRGPGATPSSTRSTP